MKGKLTAIIASLVAGILLALLTQINAELGKNIGALESTFVAHLTGSILGLALVLCLNKKRLVNDVKRVPKYFCLGGVLGVSITFVGTWVVPRLGLLLYLSLLITFNLIFSAAADHLGWFDLKQIRMNNKRALGLLLTITGVVLIFLDHVYT